jgi:hypothetical protein
VTRRPPVPAWGREAGGLTRNRSVTGAFLGRNQQQVTTTSHQERAYPAVTRATRFGTVGKAPPPELVAVARALRRGTACSRRGSSTAWVKPPLQDWAAVGTRPRPGRTGRCGRPIARKASTWGTTIRCVEQDERAAAGQRHQLEPPAAPGVFTGEAQGVLAQRVLAPERQPIEVSLSAPREQLGVDAFVGTFGCSALTGRRAIRSRHRVLLHRGSGSACRRGGETRGAQSRGRMFESLHRNPRATNPLRIIVGAKGGTRGVDRNFGAARFTRERRVRTVTPCGTPPTSTCGGSATASSWRKSPCSTRLRPRLAADGPGPDRGRASFCELPHVRQ